MRIANHPPPQFPAVVPPIQHVEEPYQRWLGIRAGVHFRFFGLLHNTSDRAIRRSSLVCLRNTLPAILFKRARVCIEVHAWARYITHTTVSR